MKISRTSKRLAWAATVGAGLGLFVSTGSALSQLSPPEGGTAVGSPTRLDFGEGPVSRPGPVRALTVRSTGRGPIVIKVAEATGVHRRDFVVLADQCRGLRLNPGSACQLRVQFQPSALDLRRAVLRVSFDNARELQVTMVGSGVVGTTSTSEPDPSTLRPTELSSPPQLRSLAADPDRLAPKRRFTVRGAGYSGMTEIRWDGTPVGEVEADSGGGILFVPMVPSDARVGDHLVEACDPSGLCGQAVVLVTHVAPGRRPWLLAVALVAALAAAHLYRRHSHRPNRRAASSYPCASFAARPAIDFLDSGALAARFPLALVCGPPLGTVKVILRDGRGRDLQPSDAHLAVQSPAGPIDVTVSQSAASHNVKLTGRHGSLRVSVHYDVPTEVLTVGGQWGAFVLKTSRDMNDRTWHGKVRWTEGPVTLTATIDRQKPKVEIEGRLGPTTVTLVAEPGRVTVAVAVDEGPLELEVDGRPGRQGVSLNADLGVAQLDCTYQREADGDAVDRGTFEVALTAGGAVLEEMDVAVTTSRSLEVVGPSHIAPAGKAS